VATTLCGTRPIGAEQGGSDSGAEGGGGAAAGKAIPQFAITLGNGLDSAAAASRILAGIAVTFVLYLLFNSVWAVLNSTIDLGGDPLDAALAYIEYTAIVLGSVLISVVMAYLADALPGLWHGRQRLTELQVQPQTQVHPVPSATNSTGAATAAVASGGEAQASGGGGGDALAEAMRSEPSPAFIAELRRAMQQVIVGIASGAWGSEEEREAILAGAGLALDAVIEQKSRRRSSGRGSFSGSAAAASHAIASHSPKAIAKELQTLLMRFPLAHAEMGKVLAEVGLRWVVPPRRSAPGRLDKWNRRWKDVTAGHADSSMFTASGVWVSPDGVVVFGALAFLCFVVYLGRFLADPSNAFVASVIFAGVLCTFLAVSLERGDRARAKRIALTIAALPLALGYGILTPIFGAAGHRGLGVALVGWGLAATLVGLVYKPRLSFYIVYGGMSGSYIVNAIATYTVPNTPIACMFAFLGTSAYLKRRTALAEAGELVAADAAAYEALWLAKLDTPGAAGALATLHAAWAFYMAEAVKEPKQQPASLGSVEALFNACDRLNPVLLATLRALCDAQGGVFHAATVKGEDRALQKVYRSYNENFRRLTDLNRCGLCFASFEEIAACLRAIVAHPDIVVLSMNKSKMRFDAEYDAVANSGGYRDVQIAVRIDTEWTRAQGLDKILCEVQLHDAEYYHRKTTGGGHKAYVQKRNMLGQ